MNKNIVKLPLVALMAFGVFACAKEESSSVSSEEIVNPLQNKSLITLTNVKRVNLIDVTRTSTFDITKTVSNSEKEYIELVEAYLKSQNIAFNPYWELVPADDYHYAPSYSITNTTITIADYEKAYYCASYNVDLDGIKYHLAAGLIDLYDPADGFVWNSFSKEKAGSQFYLGGAWNNDGGIDPVTKKNKEKQKSEHLLAYYDDEEVTKLGKTGKFVTVEDGNKVIDEQGNETGDIAHGFRFLYKPCHSMKYYDELFSEDYEISFDFAVEGTPWKYGSVYRGVQINDEAAAKYDITKDSFRGATGFAFGDYRSAYYKKNQRIQFMEANKWSHLTFRVSDYAAGLKDMMLSFDDYFGYFSGTYFLCKNVKMYLTVPQIEKSHLVESTATPIVDTAWDDYYNFEDDTYVTDEGGSVITAEEKAYLTECQTKYCKVERFLQYKDQNRETKTVTVPSSTVSINYLPSDVTTEFTYNVKIYFNSDAGSTSTVAADARVIYTKSFILNHA